nr:hypothetical protein [Gemmatimonadaceae bacterium]
MRLTRAPLTRAPHRHGHTLADALVGLLVATLALALTARAASLAIRTHARTAATVQQGHDGADALDVVAARLRDVVPADDDLLEATDGALAIRRPIGTATLCGVAGDTVTLAAGDAAAPWADDWARSPVVGDELRHVDHVGGAAGVRRILALVPLDAPCAADRRPWTLRARWRVTLD